jgi:NAD(P)-dependent dehydrogenase (short-subunit alcohol dehydrogenase family)
MNSNTFAGKVALVTGGTSGIGRAAAVEFARAGAKVVVSGRREKEGEETVGIIHAAGGEGLFVRADIGVESEVAHVVDATLRKFGRLDAAFNNAGIEGHRAPLAEQTVDNYRAIMDANVLGVFLAMKYEIPAMLRGGGGAIVNNASIAGHVGFPTVSLYCASKHAVVGMTKAAAIEYGRQGIRVNAVSPAAIMTDMLGRFFPTDEAMAGAANMHPVGRIGRPEEVTSAVLYLCSPEASFITGQALGVDGGYLAQ